MDDFLADLERNITNLGSTKHWKRQFGDTTIWLSPITLFGQERVNETINSANENAGLNLINETKRVTLSHSIVGINDIDLREYRDSVPRFPSSSKDGKIVKVTLDKYVYNKMITWGAQLVDDIFSVFADLIESEQKENLKNIKFENAKDPLEELEELEAKVAVMRESLGKPPLVEKPEEPEVPEAPAVGKGKSSPLSSVSASKEIVEVDFDPFAKIASPSEAAKSPAESRVIPPIVAPSTPNTSAPADVSPRTMTDSTGNAVPIYRSSPSISEDILEAPSAKPVAGPPVIDSVQVNKNPRFSPQSR